MNQKLEVTLEITTNGHIFRATLPLGSAYDDAIEALQKFRDQVILMRENEAKQRADAAQAAPEAPVAPTQE